MNIFLENIIRFFVLLFLQVLLFKNINLFGFLNPYPYLLFILLYPVNGNRSILLLTSFLLGLFLDMFLDSGGIHAAASVVLAFVRPSLFRFSFGLSYEYQTIKLNDSLTPERFSFILVSVLLHHIVLFTLEAFQFKFIIDILLRTLFSTIFTIITSIIIIYIIKPNKR